ncbi:acetyl-CoA C-acyltransferase [candidate division KSB1 bacterium]|nr:MAG: acetyl-CoA C-acyltransferase [candidate division KSB1 bacterium]
MKGKKKKIVFLSATRTPFGEVGGGLKDLSPIDLGYYAARAAIEKAGMEDMTDLIDQSIFGNAQHTSIDSHYGGRHVGLRAGLSYFSSGLTVNRICFSGGEAIIQACKEIILGEAEIVLAGGYESTSQSPVIQFGAAFGFPYMQGPKSYFLFPDGLFDTYINLDMMGTAENLAKLYGVTRKDADEFAFSSQQKAKDAKEKGRLAKEITPVVIKGRRGDVVVSEDEHPRPDTTIEVLSRLHAVKPGGIQTGGNSSGIVDGGAAVILTTIEKAKELGIEPIGEVISWGTAGVDPHYMGIGPVPACKIALKRAGMTFRDIDHIEINEAFAGQYLAVERELDLDRSKVNLNGGAIALGHPLGATGTRLVITLLTLGGIGIASACIGGGQGGAIIVQSYL